MKPFEPNKEQLEAIINGATMLWIPVNNNVFDIDIQSNGMISYEEHGDEYIVFANETVEDFIYNHSPLQPNEQYFIQEHSCSYCDGTDFIYEPKPLNDYRCTHCDSLHECDHELQQPHQMQEHQSNIKLKVTNVEAKQIQHLTMGEWFSLVENDRKYFGDTVAHRNWHDNQYPNQPYDTNPIGFLITIQKDN